MNQYRTHRRAHRSEGQLSDPRLRLGGGMMWGIGALFVVRLFYLMIMQHDFYTALAAGSQEFYAQLFPVRGSVFVQDSRTGEEYPVALNRDLFTLYADTRLIDTEDDVQDILSVLSERFAYDDERRDRVAAQLRKEDDPYEPLEQGIEESLADELLDLELPGIGAVRVPDRFYPEGPLAAHVVGFVGKTDDGSDIGRYGVEGYWEEELAGSGGFISGAKSAGGSLLTLADSQFEPAVDGADIVLTIDRTLQYAACERLEAAREEYGATSATLVIMDPHTGAIRAMCGTPTFDPNTYNKVESIGVYNNTAIFTPYEPGSIFKPVAMGAALNEGVVTPQTVFHDSGSVPDLCTKPIRNADLKVYDDVTMTGVLEYSINTGMVFTARQLGKKRLIDYYQAFGFGVKEGIGLDTEETGTIDTLFVNKSDKIDCYGATSSFGQGITATPLQMVTAYSAIANGGTLLKPYIVQEVRHADGAVDRYGREEVRQVMSERAAKLLAGMLVTVVDNGHAGGAAVPGYYVAGKTGTAQIPGPGGYTDETNHSFVGFAPIDDPAFVAIVKFEKPKRRFSSTTAAPVFGDIARFALQYYQVAPER